ncbi:TGF-beta-activated kinase 1 and MAP3K7-binding protein like [Quillaja saponaria]|uniref:TGF-beta-activated kinase 1 and MAP3K7-binding protein like n=1 Tax=Quillaja saponaria TaxID=32244 RepID=A0AAD7KP63_QUISA|nr:TGF-beta-activated kinase 1 and MAP3K7-binding protein like [Quillaja saponaria]
MLSGDSRNIVDSNLSILTERIEEVKKKERHGNTCCGGWNYKRSYDHDMHKKYDILSESAVFMGLASGAIGLVFLSGSICICLFSLLVHIMSYI